MDTLKTDCPCHNLNCELRGNCIICEDSHVKRGKLPYCKRNKVETLFNEGSQENNENNK